jgi:hypothetical protein
MNRLTPTNIVDVLSSTLRFMSADGLWKMLADVDRQNAENSTEMLLPLNLLRHTILDVLITKDESGVNKYFVERYGVEIV